MSGTIVVDRIESDASYASSINIASPLVVANTISMTNGAISGNVNFDSGTLVVRQDRNTVGVGTDNPNGNLHLYAGQSNEYGHLRVETTTNASITLIRSGVQAWAMYVDNSDSSQLKIGPSNSGVALTTKYFGIDSAGRVTKPNQPMVLVGLSGNQTINHNTITKVNFNTIDTQTGSNFNTSTNRFTAPVSGWYLILAHLYIYSVAQAESFIYKNGSQVTYMRAANVYVGTDTNPNHTTINHALYLNASDYIEIWAYQYSSSSSSGSIYSPATAVNIGLLY